ncbi:MAG: thioredoxin family protein [Pirellulales bacterium]
MRRQAIDRTRVGGTTLLIAAILIAGCSRSDVSRPASAEGDLATRTDAARAEPQPSVARPTAERVDTDARSVESDAAVGDVSPVAKPLSDAAPLSAVAKPERELIYDPSADGKALIAAALERATRTDKHVLIEWGGNWCGWCYKLHDVFTKDELVRPIMFEQYELVLIDQGTNETLMKSYGGEDRDYSYPHLTILDMKGKVLVNQNTEPLEEGPKHVPARVAEFLRKWAPKPLDAEAQLAAALGAAADENKRVLVHVGTPYCGWCTVLNNFLHDHEQLFARDYVDLRIDTLRMTNGEAVAKRFQPPGSLGIPWMVILDASGKVLVTSVGPAGNCGYPVDPPEIDHFLSMLKTTAQRLTASDLTELRGVLDEYRVRRDERRKAEAAKAITATAVE